MPKYSDDKLLEIEPYKSIMNVFLIYSIDHKYNRGLTQLKGIEHKQLLYVFKPSLKELETNEMIKFFKHSSRKTLKDFSEQKENKLIVRRKENGEDAIRDAGDLNKCLIRLRNRCFIEEKGEPKYYTYYLSEKFFTRQVVKDVQSLLKTWVSEVIIDYAFDEKMGNLKENQVLRIKEAITKKSAWCLFGLTPSFLDKITLKEKDRLNNIIKNVIKNLEEIVDLKSKYVDKKILNQASKMNNELAIEEIIAKSFEINFVYYGTGSYDYFK